MVTKRYKVGIDVGLNSVGLAAIEVDGDGAPLSLLNAEVVVHDSGVDPTAHKSARTRKAISGEVRRVRRLIRRRRQRLAQLDRIVQEMGWPIVNLDSLRDPHYCWRARLILSTSVITDPRELSEKLSVAVRHMARHRGWRNPYTSVQSLLSETKPSKEFRTFVQLVRKKPGLDSVTDEMTLSEIVCAALRTNPLGRIRGTRNNITPLLESKIHQSDIVRELRRIWDVQGLPPAHFQTIVKAVFHQRSPRGSAAARVGRDPLPGMGGEPRAEKASLAFQRFRIVDKVANLRVKDGLSRTERPLTPAERRRVTDFLWQADSATWDDVAAQLGLNRTDLLGTAKATELGEPGGGKPPVNVTDRRIRESGIRPLIERWDEEDEPGKEALLAVISNGSGSGDTDPASLEAQACAEEFLASLPEKAYGSLNNLKLPEGRAAYSAKTMRLITERMLASGDDLHAARKFCFPTVDDHWKPPADPVGMPVGNPAVDRVLKIVARYLAACESHWGPPEVVNIEHARDGLISESAARKLATERNKNTAMNEQARQEIPIEFLAASREAAEDDFEEQGGPARFGVRQSDVYRWRAIQRQKSRCLYCGSTLTYGTFEMDHIVPRAGQGATNTQTNLAAVCRQCNHSKGKLPFAVWAQTEAAKARGVSIADALARADDFFDVDAKRDAARQRPRTDDGRFIKAVRERLNRTHEDEAIDNRSIESVAWMANELHHRIEAHYCNGLGSKTTVGVFNGWIVSQARRAAGVEDRFMLTGGKAGKDRLDRRHHAVDAATIAMLRPGVAQVLAERDSLRRAAQVEGPQTRIRWKEHRGTDTVLFSRWQDHMLAMTDLLQQQIEADRVPVFEFLRLRLGSTQGHENTVRQLRKARVGDAWSVEQIDRSATPAQWVALTRQPDFDPSSGLPADPKRTVRIHGNWYAADDRLSYFPTGAGCVALRGGYAELGAAFHHARIYRCAKRLKSGATRAFYGMMRVYQVDLLGHAGEDLFNIGIPPQAISRRTAERRLRDALDAGEAEYMGWIVTGDELLLNMESQRRDGQVGELLSAYPKTNTWVVDGFYSESKLRLRPRGLAGEGLPDDDTTDAIKAILLGRGWVPAVDVVFGACAATVIRRDILGRPRLRSTKGLPVCWSASGDDFYWERPLRTTGAS
jgi:CRISPR-associated endonuclease Csn1